MSVTQLRPNATVTSSGVTATGAPATVHGNLSDNAGTSYVSATGTPSATAVVDMTTVAIPAGAVTKSIRVGAQAKMTSTPSASSGGRVIVIPQALGYGADGIAVGNVMTWDDRGFASAAASVRWSPWSPLSASQTALDALRLYVNLNASQNGPWPVIMYELYAEVTIALKPVCTVSGPTGSVAASSITVTAQHTPGEDGGPSEWVQFQLLQGGVVVMDTGAYRRIALGGAAVNTFTGLPPSAYTYRARSAQSINGLAHWSDWSAESAVTLNPAVSEVSSVVVTPQGPFGRVYVVINRNTGSQPWTGVDLQRNDSPDFLGGVGVAMNNLAKWSVLAGGSTGTLTLATYGGIPVLAVTNNLPASGNYYGFVSNGAYPVTTNVVSLQATISCLSSGGIWPANTQVLAGVWAYDSGGKFLREVASYLVLRPGTTEYYVSLDLTDDVSSVAPMIRAVSSSGGAVSNPFNVGDLRIHQDSWTTVSANPVDANTQQVYDYSAPSGVEVHYRARAIKTVDGNVGSWVDGSGTWNPDPGMVWIKRAVMPSVGMALDSLRKPLSFTADREVTTVFIAQRTTGRQQQRVVSYGPLTQRSSLVEVWTKTFVEMQQLLTILADGLVLVHPPASWGFASGKFVCGSVEEASVDFPEGQEYRAWTIPITEVP